MTTMVTIETIEVAGPDRRARRLVFSGAEAARTTSAAVVKALGLEPGMTGFASEFEADLAEQEVLQARERALRLLAYRERSPDELRVRLVRDGYPPALVGQIVDRFVELELVDEARFASMWAASRASAGLGVRRIRRELTERGVSEPVIEAAVAPFATGEVERATTQLRGRSATSRAEKERLMRRLIARGFSYAVAREAVDEAAGSGDDDAPFIAE